MRKLFFINDTLENKISYYHLVCFLVALPFDPFYSEVILGSFAIHTSIHLRKNRLHLLVSKPILVMASLYLFSVIALLYTNYKEEGFKLITSQLSFLLFPVLFTLNDINLEKYKFSLLKIFGLACIFVVLLLFSDAIRVILYFHLPLSSLFNKVFINQNFSQVLKLHATYFSMYVALSLSVFIFFFIEEKLPVKKILYSFCIFILLSGLIQLSSRAVVIAEFVVIFVAFPLILLNGSRRIKFIAISILISAGVYFIISYSPAFKERFTHQLKDDLTQPSARNKITEPRLIRWKAEAELIKQSPIIGYGIGAERETLKNKYFENKLYLSYEEEFNAHNQYLSFLISMGIIGLAFFLLILGYGFYIGIKNKDILLTSFLIIIAVTCISEDILNINKGIFFYSFFISYFLLSKKEE